MNKYLRVPTDVIDLHGYTTKEAEYLLLDMVKHSTHSHVRIITGKGSHGDRGPVLRDFVKKFLFMHGIHFNPAKQADGGDGALEVFLTNT
jgi:DNA-nicking Smr family endonuclease